MVYSPTADDTRPRGWTPTRGIPPAARTESTPEHLKKASSDFQGYVPKSQKPPTPRSVGNSGNTRIRGGPHQRSARDSMQAQRNQRHSRGDVRTEAERSFRDPANFDPADDEYGRPVRQLYSGRIKKRVDLKHEGESDEVIYQYTGEGSSSAHKCALAACPPPALTARSIDRLGPHAQPLASHASS